MWSQFVILWNQIRCATQECTACPYPMNTALCSGCWLPGMLSHSARTASSDTAFCNHLSITDTIITACYQQPRFFVPLLRKKLQICIKLYMRWNRSNDFKPLSLYIPTWLSCKLWVSEYIKICKTCSRKTESLKSRCSYLWRYLTLK
jgi:hypothetical protein